MNYNDITVGIVTFKSEKVIFQCLKSITKIKKIIIFDNSNDKILCQKINKKYPNIKCILSKSNIGYGAANNRVFKAATTPYVFILNPDTILDKNCIKQLISQSRVLKNKFAILSPSTKVKNYGYFKDSRNTKLIYKNILDVDFVRGFSMLVNLSKIKKVGFFDKNFFLYLEEIDLCKRLKENFEKIYIIKNAKIKHLGAKSSNIGFEFDKCRNWHWMWSNVYYDIKNHSYIFAFNKSILKVVKYHLKALFFLILFQKEKCLISFMRGSGLLNSLIGKKSWYRPTIDNS
jgi:N-acetylglucosaminyl-diphospho-decaprenol L-rhamnosyltransferase|tara:strand:- start:644 stop:1507 length:864 start_codon:yes stop_codon:yes gene_type:complete